MAVVRHIPKVYETATIHSEDDYFKREGGEIPTEVYPNFPILREFTKEIAKYKTRSKEETAVKRIFLHMQS